jgi:hypothetical protein
MAIALLLYLLVPFRFRGEVGFQLVGYASTCAERVCRMHRAWPPGQTRLVAPALPPPDQLFCCMEMKGTTIKVVVPPTGCAAVVTEITPSTSRQDLVVGAVLSYYIASSSGAVTSRCF